MNRSTLLLLALLAVLGAIVYFVLPKNEERIASYEKTPVAFTVDSASVVSLSIQRSGTTLTIQNVGGKWTITSHGNLAADPARVMEVIGGLSRFKSGSLVSTNPAKQRVFQVDSSGSLVTLTERSGARRSIIIGKMGPSFSEVYFRMPGESNVYLGSGITTWALEREVKEWRDRLIFAAPAEAITLLTLSSGGKMRAFRKDSAGWKSGPDAVPTETINPVLTALSGVRADDFIDSDAQFTGVPSVVEVGGGVSARMEFYRIANDTGRYVVKTSTSGQKYVVGRYIAGQLLRPLGEIRPAGVATLRKGAPETTIAAATPSPGAVNARPAGVAPVPPAAKRQPAKAETVPATRQPAKTEPVPAPARETAKPAAGEPASKPPSSGAVNPFKQKQGDERTSPPPATNPAAGQQAKPGTPPSAGQQTKTPPPPPTGQQTKAPAQSPAKTPEQVPAKPPASGPQKAQPPSPGGAGDDEGELTVHIVKKGESMTTIAQKYGVSVEQILKWNLLKSISVKPGQELYIFLRK